MIIGNKNINTDKHTAIMAILNVTPDSFSDGGSYKNMDDIRRRAEEMIGQGADIIDIGGESTRPGHVPVSADEELGRVIPVVECLKSEYDIPLSIDTNKSLVAEEAVRAGCCLVNDIWGLKKDERMASVIARYGVACCLMHNRTEAVYNDVIDDVMSDMRAVIARAKAAGIEDDRIILDPGIGFGKKYEHNINILKNLEVFNGLGYPMLLGASRKSVIGTALDLPVTQRVEGTIVTTVLAVMAGYDFVRVHDIEANRRAVRMTEAVMYG